MRYSIDDSTGLLLTVPKKVVRPGVTAPLEVGMVTLLSRIAEGYIAKALNPHKRYLTK